MPDRDTILAARAQLRPEPLEVPEWGPDPIYIRVLTARDQLAMTDGVSEKDMPFKVLIGTVCDEQGNPIFQPGDEEALKDFPFPVILRVFGKAAEVNGLSSKELEEAVASFATARDGSSSTA